MSDASLEAIDTRILQSWMDARNLGSGDIQDISFIAGGTQNMLMRFRREADVYVLRRPRCISERTATKQCAARRVSLEH